MHEQCKTQGKTYTTIAPLTLSIDYTLPHLHPLHRISHHIPPTLYTLSLTSSLYTLHHHLTSYPSLHTPPSHPTCCAVVLVGGITLAILL